MAERVKVICWMCWTSVPLEECNSAAPNAMQGDRAKAKAAYQNFLALWKDADPGIPIYKQAKAKFAKLKYPAPK